jgi:hypothetical protein
MDHNMRQQLMMKLARQDVPPPTQPMMGFSTPAAPPCVRLPSDAANAIV